MRKLRVRYGKYDSGGAGVAEWATIETADGWYVCSVEHCTDESAKRFRQRTRSLRRVLESHRGPLLTTEPQP